MTTRLFFGRTPPVTRRRAAGPVSIQECVLTQAITDGLLGYFDGLADQIPHAVGDGEKVC